MRKKMTYGLLASMMMVGVMSSTGSAGVVEPEEDGMKTICYYGVTMTVPAKIAKRYLKIGATMGACGEER